MATRFSPLLALSVLLPAGAMAAPASLAQPTYRFDLTTQPLADALRAIGQQTTTNIVFEPQSVENISVDALRADLTAHQAIERVLAGTKLGVQHTAANTVLVRPSADDTARAKQPATLERFTGGFHQTSSRVRLAQAGSQSQEAPRTAAAAARPAAEVAVSGDNVVVVTATKTGATRLQATPIAITAIGGGAVDRGEIKDVKDLMGRVPSVSIGQNARAEIIYIRGIGSNTVFPGGETTASVYLDGVYQANPILLATGFLDVERIEVLRGPQGTLYGRNSTAGAVNVITRDPGDAFEARGSVTAGNFATLNVSASLGGPIGERIGGSLSGASLNHQGYVRNISPTNRQRELGDEDTSAFRGKLKFALSDTASLTLTADLTQMSGTGPFNKLAYRRGNGSTPVNPPQFTPQVIDDSHTVNTPNTNFDELRTYGFTGIADFAAGSVKFLSVTGWRQLDSEFNVDSDYSEVPEFVTYVRTDGTQVSEELQASAVLGRLRWVTGLYYFREDRQTFQNPSLQRLAIQTFGLGPDDVKAQRFSDITTEAYAAYGEATYDPVPDLSITAGARYSWERKSMDHRAANLVLGTPVPVFNASIEKSWTAFTPKLGAAYRFTDDAMLFATVTRGYKGGGFNSSVAGATFEPEYLWAYEIGAKTDWLDNRLRVNLGGFVYKYDDLQVVSFLTLPTGAAATVINNAASADIKGVELELRVRPIGQLTLSLSGAWLDATYDEFPAARPTATAGQFQPASGNRLNNAPEWTGNFAVDYSVRLGPGRLGLHGDIGYLSRQFFNAFEEPVMGQAAYTLSNARIDYAPNDHWMVALFGRNLGDKVYHNAGLDFSSLGVARIINAPRTYGVQVMVNF